MRSFLARLTGRWPAGKRAITWLEKKHLQVKRIPAQAKTAAWVAAGTLVVATTIYLAHGPDGPMNWVGDKIVATWSETEPTQHKEIVLIYVTNATLSGLPYTTPINREKLRALLMAVDAARPTVIGLDFIFDRETDKSNDSKFQAAIANALAPVVVGVVDARSAPDSVDVSWQDRYLDGAHVTAERRGHIYFDENRSRYTRSDHVVRSIAEATQTDEYKVSFAETMAAASGSSLRLKTRTISWLLPPDNAETFRTFPADQVLSGGTPDFSINTLLHDKYVIIGGNFPDRDQHFTPLSFDNGLPSPGAFIHAQVLAQILAGRALYSAPDWAQALFGGLFFVAAVWLGRQKSAERSPHAIAIVSLFCLILASIVSFKLLAVLLPATAIFIGAVLGFAAGQYSVR